MQINHSKSICKTVFFKLLACPEISGVLRYKNLLYLLYFFMSLTVCWHLYQTHILLHSFESLFLFLVITTTTVCQVGFRFLLSYIYIYKYIKNLPGSNCPRTLYVALPCFWRSLNFGLLVTILQMVPGFLHSSAQSFISHVPIYNLSWRRLLAEAHSTQSSLLSLVVMTFAGIGNQVVFRLPAC